MTPQLTSKTIILGVTGGIAAYKSADLVRQLKKLEADVFVVMTEAAQKFVSPLTFRTLSRNPVITNLFSEEVIDKPILHVCLAEKADLILIAPATANIIGKISRGIADDALTTIVMASKAPKLLAPAMNANMWENHFVKKNVERLKAQGYFFVGPEAGELACGDFGEGRMAEVEKIVEAAVRILIPKLDLKGVKILVTAGGTRESIDPVRFIGNRSSGKMGYALAEAARDRGAEVTLVSGPTNLEPPAGINLINVETTQEMHDWIFGELPARRSLDEGGGDWEIVIMAAAPADYQSRKVASSKIKKSNLSLELKRTPDILKEIKDKRQETGDQRQIVVGFSVETEDLIERAKEKLKDKNLDLIIANDISAFGKEESSVKIIYKDGKIEELGKQPKKEIAGKILDAIQSLR